MLQFRQTIGNASRLSKTFLLLSFKRPGHLSSWPAPAALCFLFPLFTSTNSGETDITDNPLGEEKKRHKKVIPGNFNHFSYCATDDRRDTGGYASVGGCVKGEADIQTFPPRAFSPCSASLGIPHLKADT